VKIMAERIRCPRCEGEGTIKVSGYDMTCPLCDGMKHANLSAICTVCKGTGCSVCKYTGVHFGCEICHQCHGTGKEQKCDEKKKICTLVNCTKCSGKGIVGV
jgi:hypothetical protein